MKTALQPAAERARDDGVRLPAELVLDRYRLCERLGSGGFGTVWRGHDERLDREVAVKRIPRADGGPRGGDDRRRAAREALAAARLSHPAIVALYEAGVDDDAYYIVSELVHGATLAQLFAGDELSDARIVAIGAELAAALAHAHARGIVHRDVKPQNVIVADAGGAAKLTDFGIARIAGSAPLTHTGDVVGTLAYMAPEQADGRGAGPPADLYSLALVIYEGLAGHNPVRGATPAATARLVGRALPPLQRARRDLPADLCVAVDRALGVDPARRGSLELLRAALIAAAGELDDEDPQPRRSPWPARSRLRGPAERRPAALALSRPERLVAATGAAGLATAILAWVAPASAVAPWWGLAAGIAVALAPRAGWIATAAAAVCWLATAEPGSALLLAIALAAPPLLLPRAPALWSLPIVAPLLGAVGCALAYPAAAGRLRGLWPRLALAILGVWWLLLAEPLLGRRLLFGVAAGTRTRQAWMGSLPDAVNHALVPLLRGGTLGVALAWALGAAVLPWLVHGRRASLDALATAIWAAAVAAATLAIAHALRPRGAPIDTLWLLPGAVAAVAAVLLAGALRARGGGLEVDEQGA